MRIIGAAVVAVAPYAFAADTSPDADAPSVQGSRIVVPVVATSPLRGPGVDPNKFPGSVQSLFSEDLMRLYAMTPTEALMQRIPGISTSDPQGNDFAQDVRLRGFAASPLQGTPQGVAVYQNGIRLNEAFGDTVNWDLVPNVAVDRADVWTGNPVFGLNAIGGAVSLSMKNGFGYNGFEANVRAGSAQRLDAAVQYGARHDDVSLYVAADALSESGWREQSPAHLARLYGDLGWKRGDTELHLTGSVASNRFGAIGPTPVELLARSYRSVFTFPQTTDNDMQMVALNGTTRLGDQWTAQANVYGRHFRQDHTDGNGGDFEQCSARSSYPGQLCLQDDGFPAPPGGKTPAFRDQFVVLNAANQSVPFAGDTVPYGTVDATRGDTNTFGGSLQATGDASLAGHGNHFVGGISIDHSRVDFAAQSKLAFIYPDLSVSPNAGIAGTGQIIHTSGNLGVSPVGIASITDYYGVYATDTFDLTSALAATLGARWNLAQIRARDRLGTSPQLNGSNTFARVNPNVGLTYKFNNALTTYVSYSEANRAPTPLELGCSDPQRPCLLEGFLVSDPSISQVVARTFEGGARGNARVVDGRAEWQLSLYRTDSDKDIVNLSSLLAGRGYFTNVPRTRRDGIDFGAQFRSSNWLVYASYNYVDATYQFSGDLSSPNNPSADDNGAVHVAPGNRIPGIPSQQFKAGADYAVTPAITIGGDVVVVGGQYYVGDDANNNGRLPSYAVANLHASYALSRTVDLFGIVNNVFDRKYALYGTYFSPHDVANAIPQQLTDPRLQTPGQPASFRIVLRVRF